MGYNNDILIAGESMKTRHRQRPIPHRAAAECTGTLGVTFIELLLFGALLGVTLIVLAGLTGHSRDKMKEAQAIHMISQLDLALNAYFERYRAYPPGDINEWAADAIELLARSGACNEQLDALPHNLCYQADGRTVCLDPWGGSLHYLTGRSRFNASKARVEMNGGKPIFESSGPDRHMGRDDRALQLDNIRSDEPL